MLLNFLKKLKFYFTEKLLDCFATGTIPVYLGAPDIGKVFNIDGIITLSDEFDISDEVYYIVSDKCTECVGFHDEPQCAAVCPVDCCVDDENVRETEEELLAKKEWLHLEA